MVAQGTGHRRKLTVPLWSGRPPALGRGLRRARRAEHGQSSVETVALIPVFVAVAIAMGQGAVAGYTAWTASAVARVGARAEALGDDPEPAVRRELPEFLRRGVYVRSARADGKYAGRVLVKIEIPCLFPGLELGTVAGRAKLPSQVSA